jgi:hypothetical protein
MTDIPLDITEYDNVEPHIAAEIAIRAKQAHAPQPTAPPSYGYGLAPQQQQPLQLLQPGAPMNLANVLQSLDPSTLRKLLSNLQQQQQPQPQTMQQQNASQQAQIGADLATLLGQAARPPSATPVPAPTGPYGGTQLGVNTGYSGAGLAALLGGNQPSPVQTQPQQTQNPGQMQNIMETLAKWKQG